MIGAGQTEFSTTTPSSLAILNVNAGTVRILSGSHVTTTGSTGVQGNGTLIVDGGRLDATQLLQTS